MVQILLDRPVGILIVCGLFLLLSPASAARISKPKSTEPAPPDLLLMGGRKLTWERSFNWEREVKSKRGFWSRLIDVVAGEPEFHVLMRPYSVVTDSHGRVIVTDPGAAGVHVFDFGQQKYKFLTRAEKEKDAMLGPQCVAIDAQDNIYVTDSETGKVFVFDARGKYQRAIGSLKGGEGYFKRPTGIAVDSATQRIYVTDTLRNQIFMMDMQGSVLQ
ncbi:MAG TPA: 6-bladed beta-propeller, partial [Candidatus Angelobacter sp.]|nr:6-bladed beta-propeller [Candidatus Angelobacter sp.]